MVSRRPLALKRVLQKHTTSHAVGLSVGHPNARNGRLLQLPVRAMVECTLERWRPAQSDRGVYLYSRVHDTHMVEGDKH